MDESMVFIMNKPFKKIAASIMAVTTLTVSMVGMSASAYSDSVYFMRDAGAPSSAGVTSKAWSYYTAVNTSTISVNGFTITSGNPYIFAGIAVNGDIKAAADVYPSGGSVTATGLKTGEFAYATAEVKNISGNIRATVSITG